MVIAKKIWSRSISFFFYERSPGQNLEYNVPEKEIPESLWQTKMLYPLPFVDSVDFAGSEHSKS
jgi:hypothetical protein